MLIVAADHPGQLQLTFTDDATDVYVRMPVPVSCVGCIPTLSDLIRLLLDAAVESYELERHGDQLLGVLQRSLVDAEQR